MRGTRCDLVPWNSVFVAVTKVWRFRDPLLRERALAHGIRRHTRVLQVSVSIAHPDAGGTLDNQSAFGGAVFLRREIFDGDNMKWVERRNFSILVQDREAARSDENPFRMTNRVLMPIGGPHGEWFEAAP